jgi:hypothetical protein
LPEKSKKPWCEREMTIECSNWEGLHSERTERRAAGRGAKQNGKTDFLSKDELVTGMSPGLPFLQHVFIEDAAFQEIGDARYLSRRQELMHEEWPIV